MTTPLASLRGAASLVPASTAPVQLPPTWLPWRAFASTVGLGSSLATYLRSGWRPRNDHIAAFFLDKGFQNLLASLRPFCSALSERNPMRSEQRQFCGALSPRSLLTSAVPCVRVVCPNWTTDHRCSTWFVIIYHTMHKALPPPACSLSFLTGQLGWPQKMNVWLTLSQCTRVLLRPSLVRKGEKTKCFTF